MNDNQTRDFKGVWIPKEIWLSEELNLQEKCLLVEIDSLSSLGQCFATNEHFAKFLGLSKDRISKMISGLKLKNFVEVILIYKKGSKEIEKRIITTGGYRQKQLEGIVKNNDRGIGENNYRGIGENNEDRSFINNTVFNNTHTAKNKITKKPKEKNVCEDLKKEIEKVLGEKIGMPRLKKMIATKGLDAVKSYLLNWEQYRPNAKGTQTEYFIHCVENDREAPQPIKKQNNHTTYKTTPTHANFEQREYNEDLFEKYSCNIQS